MQPIPNDDEILKEYGQPAEGPEGLRLRLESLLSQAKQGEHYVFYQNDKQKALIKCDFSGEPRQCWFINLDGRPLSMAPSLEKVITSFFEKQCVNDLSKAERQLLIDGLSQPALPDRLLATRHAMLVAAKRQQPQKSLFTKWGLFASNKDQAKIGPETPPKPPSGPGKTT